MVDNRGISPVSNYFKPGDANSMANKMSDEKMGQGGEYFAQEMQEEEMQDGRQEVFQDRSAQLRASLNGLAMANAGSIMLMKNLKEKQEQLKNNKLKEKNKKENNQEEQEESVFEE